MYTGSFHKCTVGSVKKTWYAKFLSMESIITTLTELCVTEGISVSQYKLLELEWEPFEICVMQGVGVPHFVNWADQNTMLNRRDELLETCRH